MSGSEDHSRLAQIYTIWAADRLVMSWKIDMEAMTSRGRAEETDPAASGLARQHRAVEQGKVQLG